MRICTAAAFLAVLSSPVITLAQWTDDPFQNTPVAVSSSGQTVPKMATTPDGSTWFGWFESVGSPNFYEVRAQLFDPAGNAQFAPEGLLISNNPNPSSLVDWDLTVDAGGNAFLAFTDSRAGSDRDIYAYLISPDGQSLWGANGVTISANDDFEADPRVGALSNGEYIVVWPQLQGADRGLRFQRLDAARQPQFPVGGVRIAGGGTETPAFVRLVTTDDGFIAAWVRDTATFFSSRHIHAQKFDASGNPAWPGSFLVVSNATSVPIAHAPRIISAPDGGAAIAWHDTRDGDFDCYVQRIDASGNIVFAANGVAASTTGGGLQQLDPAITFVPGEPDILMFYNERNGAQSQWGLGIQRFDLNGGLVLGSTGVELVPLSSTNLSAPVSVVTEDGATMLYTRATGPVTNELFALRVDSSGNPVWSEPVAMSTPVSSKFRLQATIDLDTGVIRAMWEDDRNGSGDIYAQSIGPDGTLGAGGDGGTCPPDVNGDGEINLADLNLVLANFGQTTSSGDTNGDGVVNLADLNAVLAAFGISCI